MTRVNDMLSQLVESSERQGKVGMDNDVPAIVDEAKIAAKAQALRDAYRDGVVKLPQGDLKSSIQYLRPDPKIISTAGVLVNSAMNLTGSVGRGLHSLATEDKSIPTALDSLTSAAHQAPSRFANALANVSGNANEYVPTDSMVHTRFQDGYDKSVEAGNIVPSGEKKPSKLADLLDSMADYGKGEKTFSQINRDKQADIELAKAGDNPIAKAWAITKATAMNPSVVMDDAMNAIPSIAMNANPISATAFLAGTGADKISEGIKERDLNLKRDTKREAELWKRFNETYDDKGEVKEGKTELSDSEMMEMLGTPKQSNKSRTQAGTAATFSTVMDFFGDKVVLGATTPMKGVSRATMLNGLMRAASAGGPEAAAKELKTLLRNQANVRVAGAAATGAAGEGVAEFGADYFEQMSKDVDNKVKDVNQSWKAAAAGMGGGLAVSGGLAAAKEGRNLTTGLSDTVVGEKVTEVASKAKTKLQDIVNPVDDYGKRIREMGELPKEFKAPTEKYSAPKGEKLAEGYNPFQAAASLLDEAKTVFTEENIDNKQDAISAGKEYHTKLATHYNNAVTMLESVIADPNVKESTKQAYHEAAGSMVKELQRTHELLTNNALEILNSEDMPLGDKVTQSEQVGKATKADKERAADLVLSSLTSTELSTETLDNLLSNDTIKNNAKAVEAIKQARVHAANREKLDASITSIGDTKTSTQVSREYRHGNPDKAGHYGVEDYLTQASVFEATGNTAGLDNVAKRLSDWIEVGSQYEARTPALKNLREQERAYVQSALDQVNAMRKPVQEQKVAEPTQEQAQVKKEPQQAPEPVSKVQDTAPVNVEKDTNNLYKQTVAEATKKSAVAKGDKKASFISEIAESIETIKSDSSLDKSVKANTVDRLQKLHKQAVDKASPETSKETTTTYGKQIESRTPKSGKGKELLNNKTLSDIVAHSKAKGMFNFTPNKDKTVTSNHGTVTKRDSFVSAVVNRAKDAGLPTESFKQAAELLHSRIAAFVSPTIKGKANPIHVLLNEQTPLRGGLHTEYVGSAFSNPLSMFLVKRDPSNKNSTGELDPTVQATVLLAAMSWIETSGMSDMSRNIEGIQRLFGVDENTYIPASLLTKYREVGTLRKLVADEIGKSVVRSLGLKFDKNLIPHGFEENLTTAFGLYGLRMLANAGVIETNSIPTNEFASDIASLEGEALSQLSGENDKGNVVFVRLTSETNEEGYAVPSEDVTSFTAPTKLEPKLLRTLITQSRTKKQASTEPSVNPNKAGDRLDTVIPKALRDQVSTYQETPFAISTTTQSLVNRPDALEVLTALAGLDNFNPNGLHEIHRENLIDANKNKITELKRFIEALDTNPELKNKPIYIPSAIYVNMRNGMEVTDINPQSGKEVREMVTPKAMQVELTKDNISEHSEAVKLGLMSAFGVDEKTSPKAAFDRLKQVDEVIRNIPDNVETLIKSHVAGSTLSVQQLKEIEAFGKDSLNVSGIAGFKAVIEAYNYRELVDNGTPYTSNIAMEVDGITNGFILMLAQIPTLSNTQQWLERGGIFLSDNYNTFNEYINDSSNTDSYQTLGVVVNSNLGRAPALKELLEFLVGDLQDSLTGAISKAARDLMKPAFMIFNYGASLNRIAKDSRQQLKDLVLAKLEKIHESGDKGALDKLNKMLGSNIKMDTILQNNNAIKAALKKNFDNGMYGENYAHLITEAVENSIGELGEYRDVITQTNEAMWGAYASALELVTKEIKEHGREVSAAYMEALAKRLDPLLPHYYSVNGEHGTKEFTPVFKTEYKVDADSNVQVSFSNTAFEGQTKSYTAQSLHKAIINGGVSGSVMSVHAMDGSIMGRVYEKLKHKILGVHDAVQAGILDHVEASKALNRATAEVIENYSMFGDYLQSALESYEHLKNNNIVLDEKVHKELLKNLENLAHTYYITENARKESFDGKEVVVDQYPTLLGLGAVTHTFNIKDNVELDNKIQELLNIKPNRGHKSLETGFNLADAVKGIAPVEVSGKTLNTIMSQLSANAGSRLSASTKAMYDKLVGDVLAPALDKLTPTYLTIKHDVEEAGGNFGEVVGANIFMVTGKDGNSPLNSQSAEEVLLHELIHRITTENLMSDGRARAELARIFNKAKKSLNYTVFLKRDASGAIAYTNDAASEIRHAKKMFDYVFNNPVMASLEGNVRVSVGMLEFVAYGLTNPELVEALGNLDSYKEDKAKSVSFLNKSSDGNILTRLFNWVYNTLQRLVDRAVKAPKGSNLHEQLTNLTMDIASISQLSVSKNRMALTKLGTSIRDGVDRANRVITKAGSTVLTPLTNMMDLDRYSNMPNVQSALVSVKLNRLRLAMSLNRKSKEDIQKAIEQVRKAESPQTVLNALLQEQSLTSSEGLVQTMFSTVRGDVGKKADQIQRAFDRSRTMVDQTREMVRRTVKKDLQAAFAKETTTAELEALTPVLVSTDLSVLVNRYGLDAAHKMLTDGKEVGNVISEMITELATNSPENFKDLIVQAKALGVFNATGVATIPNLVTSLDGILDGIHKGPNRRNTYDDRNAAKEALSALVSAYAVQALPADLKNTASRTWSREFEANRYNNGITESLRWQEAARLEASSRIFNENSYHNVKGFTPTINDPNKEYRVARKDMENDLRAEGWKKVMAINNYDIGAVDADGLQYYVRETTTAAGFTQGAFDITSRNHAGTSVTDALRAKDGVVDKKGKKELLKALTEQFDREYAAVSKGASTGRKSYPVPIFNESGQVVDYAYRMNYENRKNVLNQNFNIVDVLSESMASTEGKANTESVNLDTIAALKKDYDDNYKNNPSDFIWISANEYMADGTRNKFREQFLRIPYEGRQAIKGHWGDMGIPVRKNMARVVLGGNKYSIMDSSAVAALQNKFPALRDSTKLRTFITNMEKIWQEIVQLAKVGIVIKTPAVVAINMVSNFMVLAVNMIDPITASRDFVEAIRELREFEKISQQEVVAKSKIRTAKTAAEREEAVQELINIRHYKDASPIKPLLEEGMFQSIVEELDTTRHGYIERIGERIYKKMEDKIGAVNTSRLTLVPRHLFMTQSSATYKFLNKITQYSDFISRYSYVKQELARNPKRAEGSQKTKETIYKEAKALFINYNLPDHQKLEYANAMGLVMFTKYYLGIQHVVAKLWANQPIEALASAIGQQVFGDISDIYDDSVVNKSPTRMFRNPLDHLDAATKMYGWQFWEGILK